MEVYFTGNVLFYLQERYGNKKITVIGDTWGYYRDTITWIDEGRFIVYLKLHDDQECTVTYYDAEYLTPPIEQAMQTYRDSRRLRID